MSTPQNILAKYRSYSYHHILIACDNEAAADFIRRSNRISTFRDVSLARGVFIDEQTKVQSVDDIDEATGDVNRTQVGAFVVILNGMISTSFIVQDVEWFTATAANAEAEDAFTSIAVEGKMNVIEPRGVRFLNALNEACNLLQTDPSGVIWMLKTIFVGHTDDGETEYIPDLRPLEFMMYDVTGTFSETGGLYEISFAGAANGAARYPQFSRVAETIPVPVPNGGKLQDAMNFLAGEMNRQSAANRKCVIEALKKSYPEASDAELDEFRQVFYAINLDSAYQEEAYKIDTLGNYEKDKAGEDGGGVIKAHPKTTVEQTIRNIMSRCSRVLKDRTEGDGQFNYIYKIHSEITMVGKTGDPVEEIENPPQNAAYVAVVYHVRRHAEFTNQTVEDVLSNEVDLGEDPTSVSSDRVKENTITFDYFFTGKNTDILEFDLKMDMGLAFLQTIGSQNTLGTGTYQISGTEVEDIVDGNNNNVKIAVPYENTSGGGDDPAVGSSGEKKKKVLVRNKTPIFPATNVSNVKTKNIRGAFDVELFNAYLSRHAALESIEATVTIHGNPYLMSSTNRRPSDVARRGNTSDEGDITNVMANWENMPGLARVNIYMPETNDTPSDRDVFNRVRFWYDGYYYIYGIDHKFSDGVFKQDLHLLSLPNRSFLDENKETNVTECGILEEEGAQTGAEGTATDSGNVKTSEAKARAKASAEAQSRRYGNADDPGGA